MSVSPRNPFGWTPAALVALTITAVTPAFAVCSVPVPPDAAGRPKRPPLPVKTPCADAKPGTEGCKGWEAYTFNDEVKAYNSALPAFKVAADAYVAKLNAYVAASNDYARCEVKALQ